MNDHQDTHAMTEVALALAMAFFSIMVVAMVGMSVGSSAATSESEKIAIDAAQKAAELVQSVGTADAENAEAANQETTYILHYQGTFYDTQGNVLDPSQAPVTGPAVLAVEANFAIEAALGLLSQFSSADLRITTLSKDWIAFLESKQ